LFWQLSAFHATDTWPFQFAKQLQAVTTKSVSWPLCHYYTHIYIDIPLSWPWLPNRKPINGEGINTIMPPNFCKLHLLIGPVRHASGEGIKLERMSHEPWAVSCELWAMSHQPASGHFGCHGNLVGHHNNTEHAPTTDHRPPEPPDLSYLSHLIHPLTCEPVVLEIPAVPPGGVHVQCHSLYA